MEIDRYLSVRARVEVDRRFAMGFVVAKAFNEPRSLAEDLEKWERKKHPPRDDDYVSDGSDIIAMFQRSGLHVVDETRH